MKAVSFIERVRDIQEEYRNVSTEDEVILIQEARMLYSQEFKPEMIVELFEGWRDYGRNFENEETYDTVYISSTKTYYDINGRQEFLYPASLDLFISDCQRAGIELTWKEEIVTKYFK